MCQPPLTLCTPPPPPPGEEGLGGGGLRQDGGPADHDGAGQAVPEALPHPGLHRPDPRPLNHHHHHPLHPHPEHTLVAKETLRSSVTRETPFFRQQQEAEGEPVESGVGNIFSF